MSDFKSGFAVMFGRPNTGKSTLLNALVGRKVAIVSPKPQTTRNRLAGVLNLPGAQIVFLDTPGIHAPKHKLGEYLVSAAQAALPDTEVVLLVADGSEPPNDEDAQSVELLRAYRSPVMLVLNKLDAIPAEQLERRRAQYRALREFADSVTVSALHGTNLDALKERLVAYLPPGPQYFPPEMVTDHPLEFMVAELIREAVLHHTHQEVPHSVAVMVEQMEQRREDLLYVEAHIFVERNSQKGIVLGERGQMVRQIGQAAREQMQNLLGTRIYLELRVKVRERWRMDEGWLRRFGYALERRRRSDS